MREAGYTFRHIAIATGFSEWRCRRIWRCQLGVVLDPDILEFRQARMLGRLEAQLDTLGKSMGLRRSPRRPRLGFQQGGLARALYRPSSPPGRDHDGNQPWKAAKKQKASKSRANRSDLNLRYPLGEVDQGEVEVEQPQWSEQWANGRDEPDWSTLAEDDIGIDAEIADGRPPLLVECERILAEEAEIKRQERRARAKLVATFDDDDDDD